MNSLEQKIKSTFYRNTDYDAREHFTEDLAKKLATVAIELAREAWQAREDQQYGMQYPYPSFEQFLKNKGI